MGTHKQVGVEQAKDAIHSYFRRFKRMPSYAEAAKLFGLKSKDSSYRLIQKLIQEGAVKKDAQGKLLPGRLDHGIKILGLVEAGFATPAEENLLDTITLDEYIVDKREASFMLRVKGDSMIGAGIHEGDMVIVERATATKTGAIVIAEVDGAWTMKYLQKDRAGKFFLEAANEKYKPIIPKHGLRITAVVKAVVRKY